MKIILAGLGFGKEKKPKPSHAARSKAYREDIKADPVRNELHKLKERVRAMDNRARVKSPEQVIHERALSRGRSSRYR